MDRLKTEELIAQIQVSIDALRGLNDAVLPPPVTAKLLAQAASLAEVSGYMLARSEIRKPVTELMLISGRLDTLAQELARLA